jgi:hypothetical protein
MDKKQKISPEKYISTKVHELPVHECLINEEWQTGGMATVMISKKMPSGKIVLAMYMVDTFCLGLKQTLYKFALSETEYSDLKEELENRHAMLECPAVFMHNLIYGAIDYAESLGFKPHKDFKVTEYFLDPELIDDGIDEIEFGRNGKPYYFAGPYDDVKGILRTLTLNVGEGKFEFTLPEDLF